ncbi:amidase [Siculibacillus lacustris]|uniref:amidase n=1 Tax=Siculibacillus lacustris TaxID=1549641 RepID=UPI0013F17179|nr:amidase [Siculibacillus lacustris]
MQPHELGARHAVAAIRARDLSCEELVRSCLDRIRTRDPLVKAWVHLDPDLAVARARECDKARAGGPLDGIPLGVKDVFSTFDMPTRCNSALYEGRPWGADAAAVDVLRASGAIVLGKTDTVEFALGGRRPLTRNPHDLDHTPGGSSAGSAAAVADRMVPLAIGTQTAGSIMRPAAFTGIFGFKPTHGLVGLEGTKVVAPSLDTVGWFARSVDDLRLVAEAFRLPKIATTAPCDGVAGLRIGLCLTPHRDSADAGVRGLLTVAAERLAAAGAEIEPVELATAFDRLTDHKDTVMYAEGSVALYPDYLRHRDALAAEFRDCVENVRAITPEGLRAAHDAIARLRIAFDRLCERRFDALLTPCTPGEAPHGLEATGDPIFNGLWTALHVPCVAVPAGRGPQGLPIGLQLVGPRYSDARLLAIAEAVAEVLGDLPPAGLTLSDGAAAVPRSRNGETIA